jgi:hypothetical protein
MTGVLKAEIIPESLMSVYVIGSINRDYEASGAALARLARC